MTFSRSSCAAVRSTERCSSKDIAHRSVTPKSTPLVLRSPECPQTPAITIKDRRRLEYFLDLRITGRRAGLCTVPPGVVQLQRCEPISSRILSTYGLYQARVRYDA